MPRFMSFLLATLLSATSFADTPSKVFVEHALSSTTGGDATLAVIVEYDFARLSQSFGRSTELTLHVRYFVEGGVRLGTQEVSAKLDPARNQILISEVTLEMLDVLGKVNLLVEVSDGEDRVRVGSQQLYLRVDKGVVELPTAPQYRALRRAAAASQPRGRDAHLKLEPGDVPGEAVGPQERCGGTTNTCIR